MLPMNTKLSCAIAAVLGGASLGASAAAPTTETGASSEGISEIVVTAQRRVESMQDVPISMQAFTTESLKQLNVATFDEFLKYLPNVTSANNGPGQNEVFMRGLSAGSQASQGSLSTGLWPNVAIYLDNQSVQLPNRNLDVYAADLARIEVLEGPQGTLFGAGAQAGVIRYITNEPKLNTTEASFEAGYGVTAHGNPNTNLTGVLNLPLVADHLAVRGVIYNDKRGGYIDNVPATFTRKPTDIGIHFADYPNGCGAAPVGPCQVPPGSPVIDNYLIAGRAINPVTYQGIRAELLYKINENWDILLAQTYQTLDTDGVFYQQPNASDGQPLKPLEVTLFNNTHNNDHFSNTAWTVNGRFGPDLRAVYTGGYLVRHVDQVGDYTNYSRGVYAAYYQCYGPASSVAGNLTSKCYSPSATWHSVHRNEHLQNEIRLSTPDDWRLRGILGAYFDNNKLFDETDWNYKSVPTCTADVPAGQPGNSGCFTLLGTFPGTTVEQPGLRGPHSSFYIDTPRTTKQTAFFASADFDLIPKQLIVTLGTRHFKFENSYVGSVLSSFGCFEQGIPPTGCHSAFSYNLDAQNLNGSESGWKSRANLTWHITPDAMVYYTWSQGFRPGGFNENGGTQHINGPDGVPQYILPSSYSSDQLTNNEIGWKTEFFSHRLVWNGALYQENWDNVQVEFFQPNLFGNLFFDTNGQNFKIRGLETSVVALVMTGLTVQGSAAWNHSEQTNSPSLITGNPASVNFGKPITQNCDSTGHNCVPVTNPFGPIGSPSANAPPLQFNVRVRYEWSINGYTPFVQFGATHQGHSFTQAGSNPTISAGQLSTSRLRFELPAYSTFAASTGIAKDAWFVTLYCENLANSNAATFISSDQFIVAETPLRPRVIGGTFGYKW
jgi:outer membrane receptor protein involved in Fe transport